MFEVVEGMPEQPYHCIHCGNNPTVEGKQQKSIFSSGIDVDWGNSVYTCWECAELIADLIDREPRASYEKLSSDYDELVAAHEELTERNTEAEEQLEKIREGAKARRAVLAGNTASSSDD